MATLVMIAFKEHRDNVSPSFLLLPTCRKKEQGRVIQGVRSQQAYFCTCLLSVPKSTGIKSGHIAGDFDDGGVSKTGCKGDKSELEQEK